MIDWIGSLRLHERSAHRVVLTLSRSTRLFGWGMLIVGLATAWKMWDLWRWGAAIPGALAALGGLLVSLERRLVFDAEDGVLRLQQRTFGITTQTTVPLFHLRAVVVLAQPRGITGGQRYVAYVDRRMGGPIYLDEARRCAPLMKMAEAIADVTELRLEYEAIPGTRM